jgi:hypothetical protein
MWRVTNLWHEPLVVDEVVLDWRGERGKSLAHHTLHPDARVFMQKPGPLTLHLKQRGRVDGIEVEEAEYRTILSKEKQAAELRSVRLMKAKIARGALTAESLPQEYRPTSAKVEIPTVEPQAEVPLPRFKRGDKSTK